MLMSVCGVWKQTVGPGIVIIFEDIVCFDKYHLFRLLMLVNYIDGYSA